MRISGLTGFLDVDGLVSQLMRAERRPLVRLEERRQALSAERGVWEQLRMRLTALRDALSALADRQAFAARTAASSDPKVVTATASAGAAVGTYEVVVERLATAHRVASAAFADPDAPRGLSGTPTVNGKPVTITPDMSLRQIASAIEAAEAGVRAMVIGGQLLLEAEQTGAAHAIAVTDDGGVLQGLGLVDANGNFLNEIQAPQDAQLRINGIALTRPGNTVADAIPGVTLTLQAASVTPVTVSVQQATQDVRVKVDAFVKAYNDLYGWLQERLAKGSAQQGNGTLLRLQASLRRLVTGEVAATGPYRHLAEVGIEARGGVGLAASQQGLLELDAGRFEQALAADAEAVARLFAATQATHGYDGVAVRLRAEAEAYTRTGGILDQLLKSVDARLDRLDEQIRVLERRLADRERQLYAEFTRLESALAQLAAQGAWLNGLLGGLWNAPGTRNR